MSRGVGIATLIIGLSAGFCGGWLFVRSHAEAKAPAHVRSLSTGQRAAGDCDDDSDANWQTVQSLFYVPVKTLYNVESQFCWGESPAQRVRITDNTEKTVFFEYKDDSIRRVEEVYLLDDHIQQLLVVTESAGTSDRVDWHVISESNGKLNEWKSPEYDTVAEKLLRPGEDFCCKEWNFHLRGRTIFLARGIYRTGEGNCCPSHGGVLVRLIPTQNRFTLAAVQRISKSEYNHWRSQPFCMECVLE